MSAGRGGTPGSPPTLYRHFSPDEAALFDACSSHLAAGKQPARPISWPGLCSYDPERRLTTALGEL